MLETVHKVKTIYFIEDSSDEVFLAQMLLEKSKINLGIQHCPDFSIL